MHTIVCGAGYTGSRVLGMLPADAATSIGRPAVDLDDPTCVLPALPPVFALLYTVPPASDSENDRRLECLLSKVPIPPARIVYLSTSGVYGDRRGNSVSEPDEPSPSTARAKRRLAAESYLADWCAGRNCELVILRVPGIYGPGRLGLERIAAGTPVIRESEAPPGNRIQVDDLAACCLRALDASSQAGIYNVGDGDHRSGSGFTKTVARLAELGAPPEVSMAEAEKTFGEARLSFLRESRILDTSKMRQVLGFTPQYADPEDGIRASLESG
ncbi:MAG: NAD-dependent epimerase/dehydratase family protein [Woeseiaceae bacterium]|nr:NAD-dependent epimerase/dehydratase family protein [Woeseiaceae bacterium]